MKSKNRHLIIILIFICTQLGSTQTITPDKVVNVKVIIPHPVTSTGVSDVEVVLSIKKGWHLNANKPLDENLSPTVLSFKDTPGITVQKITYPEASIEKLSFSDSRLALYEDEVIIKVQLKVNKKTAGRPFKLDGIVKYQPCNNQTCLFTVSKAFSISLESKNAK
jgi:DsbC/DsbD-like thiol-disulfide interchange protein